VPTNLQAEVFRILLFVQWFLDRKKTTCSRLAGTITSRAEDTSKNRPRSGMNRKHHQAAQFLHIPDPGLKFVALSLIEKHLREFAFLLSELKKQKKTIKVTVHCIATSI
jgi:protein-tyrosine phosphatase